MSNKLIRGGGGGKGSDAPPEPVVQYVYVPVAAPTVGVPAPTEAQALAAAPAETIQPETHVPVEAPDSLQSRATARILDLLCEGEIEGLVDGYRSIYLNETPLQSAAGSLNFQGVLVQVRAGTQAQTYLPGFETQESETTVGVPVLYATPIVREVTDLSVNMVRVTIGVLGLSESNLENGDLNGSSVEFAIDVQPDGGAYTPMSIGYGGALTATITGKTRSHFQQSYIFSLPGTGPWSIRVRRVTADSVSSSLVNGTAWDSFTEIIDAKFSYPNAAMVGLTLDAAQFSSIPSRGYDVKLLRVRIPNNYNPLTRAYTGIWDGTFTVAWTDNPAWCFYDLITSQRYGLGSYIPEALIDKWTLYTIGQYCDTLVSDGLGGTEPRFTMNVLLQSKEESYKVVNDLASVFRGMTYWAAGAVYATQDAPADAVALFTGANIIDGLVSREGSGRKARHTAVIVTWNDPSNFYKPAVEFVEDPEGIERYGLRKTEVVAFGCASQGQAHRVGKWILYTEKYESEVVSFSTGMDATYVRPGDIVKLRDPARSTLRAGGRVISATSNSVTIDAAYTLLPATVYTLSVVMPDGTLADRTLTNSSGAATVLTFASALASTDIVQAVWVLANPALEAETIRVLSIAETAPNVYLITGLEHYAAKFAAVESDVVLTIPPTSNLRSVADPVTELVGGEYLYRASDGTISTRLTIAFKGSANAIRYQAAYRKENGDWVSLPQTSRTYIEVDDVVPANYQIQVVAISAMGRRSAATATSLKVWGKTAPPTAVGSLAVTGHTLSWPVVTDLDLAGYEIRVNTNLSTDWDSATPVHTGLVTSSPYKLLSWVGGNNTFLIKAVDTSAIYSAGAATVTADLTPDTVVSFTIQGLSLSWTMVSSADIAGYRIKAQSGIARSWGEAVALHEGLVTSSPFAMQVVPSGTTTIMIEAVDTSGNESAVPAYIVTNLGDATVANVVEEFDFKAALWVGDLAGGTVNGSDNLVADSNTLLWKENDQADIWVPDPADLMWPGTFTSMTYEDRIIVSEALDDSTLTLATTVVGDSWFIEYRENSAALMWDDDPATLMWDGDPLLWDLPPYLPWPGSLLTDNTLYDFRITVSQGATQGEISRFIATVDAPDILERLEDIAIADAGTRLALTKPFSVIKVINATLQNDGGTAVTITIEDKDVALGPLLKTRNTSRTAVAGLIDVFVQGY